MRDKHRTRWTQPFAGSGRLAVIRRVGVVNQPWFGPERARHRIDTRAQGRVHQVGITQGGLYLAVAQQLADHFQ